MIADDFLDWLEDRRDHEPKNPYDEDGYYGVRMELFDELIQAFNSEFDTRDSPLVEPKGERKKKVPKNHHPDGSITMPGPFADQHPERPI